MFSTDHLNLKPPLGAVPDYAHPINRDLNGWWIMNEGTGDVVRDISKNKNDGVLEGGSNWSTGKFGYAVELDGADGNIVVPDSPTLDTLDPTLSRALFTFSAWVSLDVVTDTGFVAEKSNNNFANGWLLQHGAQDFFFYQDSSSTNLRTAGDVIALANTWYNVVVTINNQDNRIYVNGQLEDTDNRNRDVDSTHDLNFGVHTGNFSNATDGRLDNIRFWRRPLSAPEVRSLYHTPFIGIAPLIDPIVLMNIAAAAGANPKGPLGLSLHGPFGGPI